MILPSKTVKPVDSLYCISAYVIETLMGNQGIDFDDLLDEVNEHYSKEVSIEKLQLCLDFLFIIGKLEFKNENLKAIF